VAGARPAPGRGPSRRLGRARQSRASSPITST
jgi:hypothetical protein